MGHVHNAWALIYGFVFSQMKVKLGPLTLVWSGFFLKAQSNEQGNEGSMTGAYWTKRRQQQTSSLSVFKWGGGKISWNEPGFILEQTLGNDFAACRCEVPQPDLYNSLLESRKPVQI